jgi:hypothetical protein
MPALNLPPYFSSLPIVLKVEQRFGLAGYARLVKLLELFTTSSDRAAGLIELPPSDWRGALQAGPLELSLFLDYLAQDGWLSQEQGAEPGAPLRITLADPGPFLPMLAEPELFKCADQWRAWFTEQLNMPELTAKDPYVTQLFRRWVANNVTTQEIEAAIELARRANVGPSPAALHDFMKTVRNTKIEQACR